jgi:hypothetical protein
VADMPPLYQVYNNNQSLSQTAVYAEYLDESKIIKGRKIQAIDEFVMDNDYADKLMGFGSFSYLGITTYEALMNLEYKIVLTGVDGDYEMPIKLVGIVEDESTVMYATKELIYMAEFGIGLYEVFADDITIETGRDIANDNEIITNELFVPVVVEGEEDTTSTYTKYAVDYESVGTFSSTIDLHKEVQISHCIQMILMQQLRI